MKKINLYLAFFLIPFLTNSQTIDKNFEYIKSRYASYHPDVKVKRNGGDLIFESDKFITIEKCQQQRIKLRYIRDIHIIKEYGMNNVFIYLSKPEISITDFEKNGSTYNFPNTDRYQIGFKDMPLNELNNLVKALKKLAISNGAILID